MMILLKSECGLHLSLAKTRLLLTGLRHVLRIIVQGASNAIDSSYSKDFAIVMC